MRFCQKNLFIAMFLLVKINTISTMSTWEFRQEAAQRRVTILFKHTQGIWGETMNTSLRSCIQTLFAIGFLGHSALVQPMDKSMIVRPQSPTQRSAKKINRTLPRTQRNARTRTKSTKKTRLEQRQIDLSLAALRAAMSLEPYGVTTHAHPKFLECNEAETIKSEIIYVQTELQAIEKILSELQKKTQNQAIELPRNVGNYSCYHNSEQDIQNRIREISQAKPAELDTTEIVNNSIQISSDTLTSQPQDTDITTATIKTPQEENNNSQATKPEVQEKPAVTSNTNINNEETPHNTSSTNIFSIFKALWNFLIIKPLNYFWSLFGY